MRLNLNARIFLCGMVSQYDDSGERTGWRGLVNVDQIHMQRATMRGFIVTDHLDRWPEAIEALAALWMAGRLKYRESSSPGSSTLPPRSPGCWRATPLGNWSWPSPSLTFAATCRS